MDLASGICRSPVDTGVTHVRRLFGTQLVQRELRVDPQVNQARGGSVGVCGYLSPWREAVGRIKAFVFRWEVLGIRKPSPVSPSRISTSQLRGQCRAFPAFLRERESPA